MPERVKNLSIEYKAIKKAGKIFLGILAVGLVAASVVVGLREQRDVKLVVVPGNLEIGYDHEQGGFGITITYGKPSNYGEKRSTLFCGISQRNISEGRVCVTTSFGGIEF